LIKTGGKAGDEVEVSVGCCKESEQQEGTKFSNRVQRTGVSTVSLRVSFGVRVLSSAGDPSPITAVGVMLVLFFLFSSPLPPQEILTEP
jgi:hypothetical protein